MFAQLLLLTDHAVSTSASGEMEVVAELHLPSRASGGAKAVGVCVLLDGEMSHGGSYFGDAVLDSNDRLVVTSTISLGTLGNDYTTVARGAYELTTDLLAEFGVAEPRLLKPDGSWTPENAGRHLGYVGDWLRRNLADSGIS